jgi:hypothetical protein
MEQLNLFQEDKPKRRSLVESEVKRTVSINGKHFCWALLKSSETLCAVDVESMEVLEPTYTDAMCWWPCMVENEGDVVWVIV